MSSNRIEPKTKYLSKLMFTMDMKTRNILVVGIVLALVFLYGCTSTQPLPQPPLVEPDTQIFETRICSGNTITASELRDAEITFIDVVDAIKSLDEFERWLKLQPCITSVVQEKGIIETQPPMKEFVTTFKISEGQVTFKLIDVSILDNNKFVFNEMHDSEYNRPPRPD